MHVPGGGVWQILGHDVTGITDNCNDREGSSGGPVFSMTTGLVEGVTSYDCTGFLTCPQGAFSGEGSVPHFVQYVGEGPGIKRNGVPDVLEKGAGLLWDNSGGLARLWRLTANDSFASFQDIIQLAALDGQPFPEIRAYSRRNMAHAKLLVSSLVNLPQGGTVWYATIYRL